MAQPMLGQYLVDEGYINQADLENALVKQSDLRANKLPHTELGNILLTFKYLTEEELCKAIYSFIEKEPSCQFAKDLPYVATNTINLSRDMIELIGRNFELIRTSNTLPYYYDEDTREMSYITLGDKITVDAFHAKFTLKSSKGIRSWRAVKTFEVPFVELLHKISGLIGKELRGDSNYNIYKLTLNDRIGNMFRDAVKLKTSDIFILPFKDRVRVKFKVDTVGRIYDDHFAESDDNSKIAYIILRLCGLPDTELQNGTADGSIESLFGEVDRTWSARVNIMKTVTGFKIVFRLIPNEQKILTLTELGMPKNIESYVKHNSDKEAGLVLITGHMGSGKNTTIYASLLEIDSVVREVATVEDPVERRLPNISQTDVSGNLNFKKVAGAMVRQAIDVLFIGEIRDADTINLAVDAAGAGMLLFSTLHIDRIAQVWSRAYALDKTILPRFITSLEGIMTQKLIRKICPACGKQISFDQLSEAEQSYMKTSKFYKRNSSGERERVNYNGKFYKGTGCSKCHNTGYKGVTVVTEMLPLTPGLKLKLSEKTDFIQLEHFTDVYMEDKRLSFKYQGMSLLHSGITTVEELQRKNVFDFDIEQ